MYAFFALYLTTNCRKITEYLHLRVKSDVSYLTKISRNLKFFKKIENKFFLENLHFCVKSSAFGVCVLCTLFNDEMQKYTDSLNFPVKSSALDLTTICRNSKFSLQKLKNKFFFQKSAFLRQI